MSEPDEAMVEAVATAVHQARWHYNSIDPPYPSDVRIARAALSVPVVRDALARAQVECPAIADDAGTTYCPLAEANMRAVARDAQVAREVGTPDDRMWMSPGECAELFHEIAALYPSPGDRDDSEDQR